MLPPIILSIAGSDCSGGAGIQADIKTISALGGYAASVITAVTVQNTLGVQGVHPVPVDIVRQQIEAVMDDLQPCAVKIGMVYNSDIVHAIVACIQKYRPKYVVYDPVMISTSGRRLMTEETICTIKEELFPLCTLVTPNLSEASLLLEMPVSTVEEMDQAAVSLSNQYQTSFLIKGGHLKSEEMCDILHTYPAPLRKDPRQTICYHYIGSKVESQNLHGTGCTLSSAIATYLASGKSLRSAILEGKVYTHTAIRNGKDLQIGHGNGPLWHFPLKKSLRVWLLHYFLYS